MSLPLTSPPKSVCLLRLSALGDVCHAVPVVRTLQHRWPSTAISWVIGRVEAELVGDLPGVEFITFDKRQGAGAFAALRRTLRGRRFDVLLHMQVALRASLASLLVKADLRLGYDRARAKDWQWLFTNARIAAHPRQHVMDAMFGFAEALGASERVLRWDIPIPKSARARARELTGSKGFLVINPSSSDRARNWRNWTVEGYAALADHAAQHHGMRALLTGGPADTERELARAICALAHCRPVDLVGRTNLKELLAILARAAVVVGPDTGPLHMAGAAGTPVIGLYASSNPERTGPYSSRRWTVNRYPDAARELLGKPVEELPWGMRVRDPRAMRLITVEEVTAMLDRVLAERASGRESRKA